MYRGLDEQRLSLFAALGDLHGRGITDKALEAALLNAKAANRIPEFGKDHKAYVSRATINRYRRSSDPYLRSANRTQIGLLYNFLVTTPDFISRLSSEGKRLTSAHELAPLLQALHDHVGPIGGQLNPEHLKSFQGTFMVYRQSWISSNANDFMTSVMTFDWVGNGLFFTDTQKYPDPSSPHPVDEIDTGVALPFGMSVALLSRGQNHEMLRFSSIDDMYSFPNGRRTVVKFSGNAMAVSGKGPHPGYPFAALRVDDPLQATSKIMNRSELPESILVALNRAARRDV